MENTSTADLKKLYEEGRVEELKSELVKLHPAELAEIIEDISSEEDALRLFEILPDDLAADVLLELDEDDQNRILRKTSSEEIADRFLSNMDTDDAADLIRDLGKEQQDTILSLVDDVEQAGDIIDLLHYKQDTAGGVMRKEMVVINENWSMPRCVDEMRRQAEQLDELYYIYVVDDEGRLVGILPLKKVITNPNVNMIKNVMQKEPVSLHVNDEIEEVIDAFEKYDLVAIPVIDSSRRLVGVITVDDVVDEMREQHEKDYQMASGLSQDVESSDTVLRQTWARLPWLFIGMVGGIVNSWILGGFDNVFSLLPAAALFIPLIGGTGGNVGTQSSAIIVQDLASNSIREGDIPGLFLKEFLVSLINAGIISLGVFLYIYFFMNEPLLMISVAVSLFCVVLFASLFGTMVPLLMDKHKIDPARATGPFITIVNDLFGMFIYMLITLGLFSYFG